MPAKKQKTNEEPTICPNFWAARLKSIIIFVSDNIAAVCEQQQDTSSMHTTIKKLTNCMDGTAQPTYNEINKVPQTSREKVLE